VRNSSSVKEPLKGGEKTPKGIKDVAPKPSQPINSQTVSGSRF